MTILVSLPTCLKSGTGIVLERAICVQCLGCILLYTFMVRTLKGLHKHIHHRWDMHVQAQQQWVKERMLPAGRPSRYRSDRS